MVWVASARAIRSLAVVPSLVFDSDFRHESSARRGQHALNVAKHQITASVPSRVRNTAEPAARRSQVTLTQTVLASTPRILGRQR